MHSEMSWGKHLLVKTTAVMGPNVAMGVQEAIHLNRLLREASDGSSRPTLDTWNFWCHRWY